MTLSPSELVTLLKKKGTGASMSKHLTQEESLNVRACFKDESLSLTTRATLLVAVWMLPMTDDEAAVFEPLKASPQTYLPETCQFLAEEQLAEGSYERLVQRVVNGEDLNESDMRQGMDGLFSSNCPEYQAAMFLEAERLKRETPVENETALEVLWDHTQRLQADVPVLIDLSLGYDGFNRTPFLSLFLAPLLAAMGYPTVCHGVEAVAPKRGVTFHKVLKAAGKDPLKPLSVVKEDLETVGWGYCDQQSFSPATAGLVGFRSRLVKRPVLATVEKLMQPLSAAGQSYLVTGYTHPPYRDKMVNLLKDRGDWVGFLVCRGVEGSIQLPLDRRAPMIHWDGKTVTEGFVKPDTLGLALQAWPEDQETDTQSSLDLGLAALNNEPGLAKDTLLYMATMIVSQLGLLTQAEAFSAAEDALTDGRALKAFQKLG